MMKQPTSHDMPKELEQIVQSIYGSDFSEHTLHLMDNYIYNILNGKTNLTQFNQPEHAGLCLAGEMLIGAYIVCHYARTSLEASSDAATSKASPANWEIDALQEKMVQQWAEAKGCWFPHAEQDIESEYGTMIAEGAEAKVYYKEGDTSVIKIRTSIYATLGRALVAARGFRDNYDGQGINYIGDRLCLEDMHPANVFIDIVSNTPICIDCIVKFIRK